ncbi:MHYT domain (predicted integral membrane sensor domain) [Mycobacteroides abscessus subsp. abscessus]|nr:MHYT domain (predicted integral membrane sensor domain) [Mycobacteroides abscessus subsp. abscessus]
MGVAVVGMHYTGMAAVSVTVDQSIPVPEGAEVFSFLFPVFVMGLLGLAVPITVLLISDPDDLAASEPV